MKQQPFKVFEHQSGKYHCIAQTSHQAATIANFEGKAWVPKSTAEEWKAAPHNKQLTDWAGTSPAQSICQNNPGLINLARA